MKQERNVRGMASVVRMVSVVFVLLLGSLYLWLHEPIWLHEPNDCYRVEVIQSNNGYGYRLYERGRTVIFQPFIPALPGKVAFHTKEDALRIGNLVMERILAGDNFSISKADLNYLRITY